ncbi:MAG: glucose-6-phosphate dehydrogenase [Candidatus Aureabacteria bacterium]|nr:glucose-6-phosphate dehydrogenase [Candidatus Auribacterota bacterium]
MSALERPGATLITIFGAGGDLTQRKLIPSLYNLYLDKLLPEHFMVAGLDRSGMNEDEFRQHLREGVDTYSRRGKAEDAPWRDFASHVSIFKADLLSPKTYTDIAERLASKENEWNAEPSCIFYLAVPPNMIEIIARGLTKARLNIERARVRIVVEKPFGHNLDSARKLNQMLTESFHENQIYRIDHYLGKDTVQNILAFRYGNTIFEPIWNRSYIDHVQITVAEKLGVEHRGGYYEGAGALRDMIQNHLLQILCLIAMEAPVSFNDNEVRNKKVDVLHAIRPIPHDQVHRYAARGQYGAGWIEGEQVCGYRQEPGVAQDSCTETFAAVKLFVDNWRWQDVPFYLRTGKRLPSRISEVAIQFRPVPHQTFPLAAAPELRPNRLLLLIQPEEGILLRFEVKHPGSTMTLSPVMMQFSYREAFKTPSPDAYETLLLDVMKADATLFMRADQAEAGWSALAPILEVWDSTRATDFPNYQAGSWGPEEAEILISQDGHGWMMPTYMQCEKDAAVCRVTTEPKT